MNDTIEVIEEEIEFSLEEVEEEFFSEIIPITPTEDILISIHQVEQKQLERLEVINDFIYLFVVLIVVYACYKFIWGLLSYERF